MLLLRSAVSVSDEEIRALDEALRISQRKFSGGSATRFDLLTTQVRLANAHNNRTDTQSSLEKQEALMRQLLGYEPGAPLALAGDFGAPGEPPDLSATIAAGLQHRPEMKLAHDSADSANTRLDAANRENRRHWQPTHRPERRGRPAPGNVLQPGLRGRGRKRLGSDLHGPAHHRPAHQARADLRAAESRVDELHRTIATDVSDALADLKAAIARLASADTLVAQANEAMNLAQTRYTNGVITNFELLDAQSNARSAELARFQARYDCAIARHAVARAGRRTARALAGFFPRHPLIDAAAALCCPSAHCHVHDHRRRGKEYGPVTAGQVRRGRGGRANLETRAKALGTDDWKSLGDFPTLPAPAKPISPVGFDPSAGAERSPRKSRPGRENRYSSCLSEAAGNS